MKKRKDSLRESPEYQDLLSNIKKLFQDAQEQGVDLFKRD